MKKTLLFASMLLAGSMLAQQRVFYAPWQDNSIYSGTMPSPKGGNAVYADPATGNIYTVGTFKNSVIIGGFPLTSIGDNDIYVAKYNSSGTCLKAIKLGTTGMDEGYDITIKSGSVYVTGYANNNGMLYKLDDDATPLDLVLSRNLGYGVKPRAINNYSSQPKLVVAGSFTSEAWLPKSSGTIYLQSSNFYSLESGIQYIDAFTGIIDLNCNFTLADNPHSSTRDNEILSIACRNGRVYATGYFQGDMQWASGSSITSCQGVNDVFVASVFVGSLVSSVTFSTDFLRAGTNEAAPVGAESDPFWKEYGYDIAVNATAIYVAGNLNPAGPISFGTSTFPLSSTGAGAFAARIDFGPSNSVGSTAAWVKGSFNCLYDTPASQSIAYSIAIDGNGDLFVTGHAMGESKPFGFCLNSDGSPGFITKINPSGTVLLQDVINENCIVNGKTESHDIAVNGCKVFVTGFFYQTPFNAGNLPAETAGLGQGASFIFEINRDIMVSENYTNCISCSGFPITKNLVATGGTSYTWSPATYLSTTTGSTTNYSLTSCNNSGTTVYSVNVTGACPATPTVSVTAGATASANAGVDRLVCPGNVITLGSPNTGAYTYEWSPSHHLSSTTAAQPTLTVPSSGLGFSSILYTVTVTDACGGTATDQVLVTANPLCPRSMANPALDNQVASAIYPNPSEGILSISVNPDQMESPVTIEVIDLNGSVVYNSVQGGTEGIITVDLNRLASGIYMMKISRRGKTEIHKVVME